MKEERRRTTPGTKAEVSECRSVADIAACGVLADVRRYIAPSSPLAPIERRARRYRASSSPIYRRYRAAVERRYRAAVERRAKLSGAAPSSPIESAKLADIER